MTKIKLCGLRRRCDIEAANALVPAYVGFVFAPQSRRYISPEAAAALKQRLSAGIQAVGVFVREKPETAAALLNSGIVDMAQLHGGEDEAYIRRLRALTSKPVIQAFRIDTERDAAAAAHSRADFVLLDSGGGGTGTVFDWTLIQGFPRPYFLAGGLDAVNVGQAVKALAPYAVDVSSGVETGGWKDPKKMAAFVAAVRKEEER